MTERFLTVAELAERCHVREDAVYRWRMRGVGPPAVRINGGKVLFAESDVAEWLDSQRERSTVDARG